MPYCPHCGAQSPRHYSDCPAVNQLQPPPNQGNYYEPQRNQGKCPECRGKGYTRHPFTGLTVPCRSCHLGEQWERSGGRFRTEFR